MCIRDRFNIPLDLMDLDPTEVMEIVVFNGNSGNATHITDKEQIQHIVENLNGVEMCIRDSSKNVP